MIFTVTYYTLRHQLTPERILGRVVILTRVIAFSMVPIAPLIGGALLAATGQFWPVIALAAVVQAGIGVMALWTPLVATRVASQGGSVEDRPGTAEERWTAVEER
jgi:hypothetical protein